uniref:Transmembrane protein 234 homolog n=1 Tax=Caenorhabditis japonica TaxID=281687 RepID=A0A8R1EBG3_CAEJA
MAECGAQCALSIITVGFVWGATNPFLRRGATKQEDLERKKEDERLLEIVGRFLKSFLDWRFSVPFVINQSGSILFNALVVNFPVTIVVPCVNVIQLIATILVGRALGEKIDKSSARQTIGMLLASTAIIGMLCVD